MKQRVYCISGTDNSEYYNLYQKIRKDGKCINAINNVIYGISIWLYNNIKYTITEDLENGIGYSIEW